MAQIFHIMPRSSCLFGKIHFLITLKLSIEVTAPRWVILNNEVAFNIRIVILIIITQ